ncbi:glycoside hydrolase [Ceraceosorus guamensis]|uniref:glucan 1,3-beta-glucosidase n=1 Tax=Ceraceosorus guamensis TaxID=1522189 RepID=A0A316W1U1_9BASI|nr:glycoside hydrolase [Ceraceosorus guamensis]PWN43712.1 glycoside hydrolase [Ceraceosorus guamensis]
MASKNADGTSNAATKGSNSGSSSGSGSSGKGGSSGSTNANTTDPNAPVTPLPRWNFTDPNQKMIGVNIGNWLVLERWLDEDWFTQTAGDNAYDEWDFSQSLGNKALSTLQDHWNTWVTEAEIDTLVAAGINTFRLNVGHWAFIPAASGEPYLAMSGQKEQLDKMLGWLYDRKVYAIIDLHGMPGSQNGDQSSGHRGNIGWFTQDNVGRSYDTVNAVVAWLSNHKYKSVVHSVGIINEPQSHNDDDRLQMLRSYYEGTYQILSKAGLTTFFHHAFVNNQKPLDYWRDFATGKDPNLLVYEDHPYPGYFPLNKDASSIVNTICDLAQQSVGYPVPVSYMEWSAVNGVEQDGFTQSYYNTQLSAFAWSAGSTFWTFKAKHSSNPREAIASYLMDEYSLVTLIANGIVAKTANKDQSLSTIKALPNQQCGNIPVASWSNPSKTGAGYSGRRRDISEEAVPQQHLVRRMRSKRSMSA